MILLMLLGLINGEVSFDRLAYGDWLRTHANAQQSKYVNGSLRKIYGRTSGT